ncbi:MAG: hypothetical protein WAZ19_12795 [Anaerolineae bacterium]
MSRLRVWVGLLVITGLILSSCSARQTALPSDSSQAQMSLLQRGVLAPGRMASGNASEVANSQNDPVIIQGEAVGPVAVVNLADVPSRPSPMDRLLQKYLNGEIKSERDAFLAGESAAVENDIPVTEEAFRAMVQASLHQEPDSTVQNYQPEAALGTLNLGTNFKSIDYSQSQQGVPPDPDIMVGRTHVVVGVNTSFQVFDKSGASVFGPILYEDFWSNNGATCATGESDVVLFDPYSAYDEQAGRYILGITAFDESLNSGDNGWACIAVSTTDSAAGSWYLYNIDGNPGTGTDYFFDYPHIGVGQNALYMSANMFGNRAWFKSRDYGG